MSERFTSGIVAAPVTPFTSNAAVHWPTLDRYIAEVAAGRPSGIAVNMAASEGGSLECGEQLEVVSRAKRAAAGACPILSGVIATHTAGARETARRLEDAGANGLVVFPPLPTFISKPLPVSAVVDFHAAIAEAVALPIVAFQTANVDYPPGTLAALARIDRLVAVKDAAFNVDRTAALLEEAEAGAGKVSVLTGNDTFILEALLMGCSGALIGFAGTATAELVRMYELVRENQITEAYAIWRVLGPLARVCWRPPLRDYRVRMKYVLLRQGVIPDMTARLPQPPITEPDRRDIDRVLERFGLLDQRYRPAAPAARLRAAS